MAEAKLNPRGDAGMPLEIHFGSGDSDFVVLSANDHLICYGVSYMPCLPVDKSNDYQMLVLPAGATMMQPVTRCVGFGALADKSRLSTAIDLAVGATKATVKAAMRVVVNPTVADAHDHTRFKVLVYWHNGFGMCPDLSKMEYPVASGPKSEPEGSYCAGWRDRIVDPDFFLSGNAHRVHPIVTGEGWNWTEDVTDQLDQPHAVAPAAAEVQSPKANDAALALPRTCDAGGADDYLPARKLVALFRGRKRKLRDTGI